MAGYSKIYIVGERGGHKGSDDIGKIYFQILVGNASRQWLEVRFFDEKIKSLGKVNRVIPQRPNDTNSLLDACIAFYPKHFHKCRGLRKMKEMLKEKTMLDLNVGRPEGWEELRKEAFPRFTHLNIWEGKLEKVEV